MAGLAIRILALVALACSTGRTAFGYPTFWRECDKHPTEALGKHLAPVKDRWVSVGRAVGAAPRGCHPRGLSPMYICDKFGPSGAVFGVFRTQGQLLWCFRATSLKLLKVNEDGGKPLPVSEFCPGVVYELKVTYGPADAEETTEDEEGEEDDGEEGTTEDEGEDDGGEGITESEDDGEEETTEGEEGEDDGMEGITEGEDDGEETTEGEEGEDDGMEGTTEGEDDGEETTEGEEGEDDGEEETTEDEEGEDDGEEGSTEDEEVDGRRSMVTASSGVFEQDGDDEGLECGGIRKTNNKQRPKHKMTWTADCPETAVGKPGEVTFMITSATGEHSKYYQRKVTFKRGADCPPCEV
ncbi:unnamed protein product [Ostreobium quekettii]|uniref:Uncharacterized protein n=1 Tax=Ostreobium quekettii TaxID=121088 RepID=A0A8S1IYM6_9CHLO|nr:unnamed protein product [Ostreobium quekettii]